jgi:hypothetical protein
VTLIVALQFDEWSWLLDLVQPVRCGVVMELVQRVWVGDGFGPTKRVDLPPKLQQVGLGLRVCPRFREGSDCACTGARRRHQPSHHI